MRLANIAAAVAAATVLAGAQTTFDAVSIKPSASTPPVGGSPTGFRPGGLYISRFSNILNVIAIAYRPNGPGSLPFTQVDATHVPGWVSTQRFDVEARVANPPAGWGASDEANQPPLRAVLEERFKLKAHFEKRDVPSYTMVVARSDGRLGPGLRPTTAYDCDAINMMRDQQRLSPGSPPPALPAPPPGRSLCAIGFGRDSAYGGSVTIALLVQGLRGTIGRPIVDRTGLTGRFDVDLHWTPDAAGVGTTDASRAAAIPEWPPIVTAVEDQLGLKLESTREPLDVLVIDHIEQPTPD